MQPSNQAFSLIYLSGSFSATQQSARYKELVDMSRGQSVVCRYGGRSHYLHHGDPRPHHGGPPHPAHCGALHRGHRHRGGAALSDALDRSLKQRFPKISQSTITEKPPSRAFSWLKAPTAKQTLTVDPW